MIEQIKTVNGSAKQNIKEIINLNGLLTYKIKRN